MRLLVLCLACTGCQALFHIDKVPPLGDAASGIDSAFDGANGPNLVFVTSQKIVPGSLGSVAAADEMCTSFATAAGHAGTYVAWLSSSTSSPTSRIGTTARGWVRPDGRPFADTLVDIAQGHVWYPLRLTEAGDDVASSGVAQDLVVVTGTNPDGSPSTSTCNDYTSTTPGVSAGLADNSPYGWSSNMGAGCSDMVRLYCFQVDHDFPVALAPESTRTAFVTVNDLTGNATPAGFDQECNTEAASVGMSGTYLAAVATTTQSALARFKPGAPWVRADGVTTIDSSGHMLAPVFFTLGGGVDITIAWNGAPSLTATAPTLAASCNDWTASTAIMGLTGNVTRSGAEGFGGIPNTCNNALRVYCLQDQ
jgi:hypothetical protein